MKTLQKLFISFIILILSVLFFGCKSNTNDLKYKEVVIAQWGQEKYLIYLPLYIAMEKKYFEDNGISIKLKYSGNDDQVFATVIKGDAAFGVGDPVFTAISRERGFKGKVVATIVNGVSIWGVTNNVNIKPIEKISDLAGIKIGTFPEPSTNYTLMKKTIQDNPILKNTKIIQAPIGSQLALLENRTADIAMELEPSTSLAISKGYKLVFSSPNFYGEFAFTGLTTTEDFIEMNPDVVQKIVTSLERAVQYCNNHLDTTITIAQKLFPTLDKSVIEMAVKRMVKEKTLPQHVITSDSAWNNAVDVRVIIGDLTNKKNSKEAVENSFAIKSQKMK